MIGKNTICRLCGSNIINEIINLGKSAPANAYINTYKPQKNNKFPLSVFKCAECDSVQLSYTVEPELLFNNYHYRSGDVPSLVKHFEQYAKEVSSQIPSLSKVLDIGSNDGALLKEFNKLGHFVTGVEPSQNLADLAETAGIDTCCCFFNEKTAIKLSQDLGLFDLITCNNCFAHIDDIESVVLGIKRLLKINGIFIFENAYLLDTIKGLYFDQIYSEHIFYHSIKPLKRFLKQFDLQIFKVEHNNIQGGTIRVFVKNSLNNLKIHESVEKYIKEEEEYGLYDFSCYDIFNEKILALKRQINRFIYNNRDKTFSCFGASAKFTTFCSYFGLDNQIINYVVDNSVAKQGLLTPDNEVPIVSPAYLIENPTDYCIITAWNFADFIVKANPEYIKNGGKFIVPMPEFNILNQLLCSIFQKKI